MACPPNLRRIVSLIRAVPKMGRSSSLTRHYIVFVAYLARCSLCGWRVRAVSEDDDTGSSALRNYLDSDRPDLHIWMRKLHSNGMPVSIPYVWWTGSVVPNVIVRICQWASRRLIFARSSGQCINAMVIISDRTKLKIQSASASAGARKELWLISSHSLFSASLSAKFSWSWNIVIDQVVVRSSINSSVQSSALNWKQIEWMINSPETIYNLHWSYRENLAQKLKLTRYLLPET